MHTRTRLLARPLRVAAVYVITTVLAVGCGDDPAETTGDGSSVSATGLTSASASATSTGASDGASSTGDGASSTSAASATGTSTTDDPGTTAATGQSSNGDSTGNTTEISTTGSTDGTTTGGDTGTTGEPPLIDDCVLIVDDLSDGSSDAAVVSGGEFIAGGWTPKVNKDHLRYDLPDPVVDGGAQLWITNFDPPAQSTSGKHHIFAGRSTSNEGEGGDWWRWRSGQNYSGGKDGTMKLLTALDPLDQVEVRTLGEQAYDLGKTYRLKTTWRVSGEVEFFFDGQKLWDATWDDPITTNFVFLARDGYHGYPTAVGATYARLVVWSGEEPAELGAVAVGCL